MRRGTIGTAVAVVSIAGLTLTGCSGSGGDAGGGSGGGTTLTLWHNTQDPAAVLGIYEAYEKATGNTIELVPITSDGFEDATLTKWATGDRPDILEFHATTSYITMLNPVENLQDLSDEEFVEKSGPLYDMGGRGADGKVYAAITNFPEVWGLYYNKAVLAEHGLEPARTADDLVAQCETLKAAGKVTLSEAGGSVWPPVGIPWLYGSSVAEDGWSESVVAREAKVNDPDSPVLAGIEYYKSLLDAGCMNPDIATATFEDSVAQVLNGEAAYQLIHSNIAPVYVDAANGDAALVDESVGFTGWGAEAVTIVNPGPIGSYLLPKTGDAAKEEAAREFIRFATGEHYPDYIEESGTFPVIEGVDDPEASELMKSIKKAYDDGPQVAMFHADLPGGMAGYVPLASELIAGQSSPKEIVDALDTQMVQAAKSMGLEGW
ncbi:ABC transporter substrate-binding protein [Naasia sp. SYSU D00948]|uniref:ABC transporter substrate-binding protein n=1 Tax=Naasia sp. SYSU D00948 TaxID=2817379 RepID=UPI001B30F11B|nr:ABC transporter substrate-binding protein [Naasia sp. SYSU D00948]